MLAWIKRLLGIGEAVLYLFRCTVCALEETLSLDGAKKRGWAYREGCWRCNKCGN